MQESARSRRAQGENSAALTPLLSLDKMGLVRAVEEGRRRWVKRPVNLWKRGFGILEVEVGALRGWR